MKKLLFILPYYKIGGTLTSFSNLIRIIKGDYEISAFALTNDIDDVAILPEGVNYINSNIDSSAEKVPQSGFRRMITSLLKKVKRFLTWIGFDPSEVVFRQMAKPLSGKFDVVVAFQEGQATRMAQYISAPDKIAWIHCIYSRLKNIDKSFTPDVYDNFDKIVCVSNTAAKDMIESEPQWKDKIHVVYNSINSNDLKEKAAGGIKFKKAINLVSIGRIDPVKRFSHIPEIASKLKVYGFEFDWWVIGGVAVQEEQDLLIKNIKQYQVEDCIHLMGALSNPYPYIKSSNMLICLSSSETFNYTIAEAKAIGTPVITTDFPSSYEFVKNGKDGLILPLETLAEGIKRMLEDDVLYSEISNYLIVNQGEQSITKEQFKSLLSNG